MEVDISRGAHAAVHVLRRGSGGLEVDAQRERGPRATAFDIANRVLEREASGAAVSENLHDRGR
jgi:hypothetical protein